MEDNHLCLQAQIWTFSREGDCTCAQNENFSLRENTSSNFFPKCPDLFFSFENKVTILKENDVIRNQQRHFRRLEHCYVKFKKHCLKRKARGSPQTGVDVFGGVWVKEYIGTAPAPPNPDLHPVLGTQHKRQGRSRKGMGSDPYVCQAPHLDPLSLPKQARLACISCTHGQ